MRATRVGGPSRRLLLVGGRLMNVLMPARIRASRLVTAVRMCLLGEMRADDVLEVLAVLRSAGIPVWIAGGWGVDALVHRQTRQHHDLDLIVGDFETNQPLACNALSAVGFQVCDKSPGGKWMPLRLTVEDNAGHRVDLLGVDRALLASSDCAADTKPRAIHLLSPGHSLLPTRAIVEGVIGGQSVPCIATDIQLLFHSGYVSRAEDSHDIALLRQG